MSFFFSRKLLPLPIPPKRAGLSPLFEKEGKRLSVEEFEKETGAPFLSHLDFGDAKVYTDLVARGIKQAKKEAVTREQLWMGSYFKKEIASGAVPDVEIRWIGPEIGWGVFAARDFRKMEFIAEYSGKVRKRRRSDGKNAYCFEYVVVQGVKTPYTIDALEQGGVARYINHSSKPNLLTSLATFDFLSHVVLFTARPIAKGEQLGYDYGDDYWAKRTPPSQL